MYENKKITLATFKTFVKKYAAHLQIMSKSRFNGMIDGLDYTKREDRCFVPLERKRLTEWDYIHALERGTSKEQLEENVFNCRNTLGYQGIWLVGQSRDSFAAYDDGEYTGIEVYNCCGSYIIAVRKEAIAA